MNTSNHLEISYCPNKKITSNNWNVAILLGLMYLLLPNLLFLLGWVRLWLAFPLSVALFIAVLHSWIQTRRYGSVRCFYSWKDYAALMGTLLLALFVVESLGLHGHITQMGDFNVRTPIYYTLIEQPWPIFSETGDYFIYYHIFWLPPALVAKVFGAYISPDTILFLWLYLGIGLFILIIFRKWRSKVFLLFLTICLLGSFVDNLMFLP